MPKRATLDPDPGLCPEPRTRREQRDRELPCPLRVSVSLHSIKGYGLDFLPAVENLHPQACPLDFVPALTSTTTQDFDYLPRNPLDTD